MGITISGMHVTVVPLRSGGMKQRGAALEGYLIVDEVANHLHQEFHARSQARLHRAADTSKGALCSPLFDPVLLQWDSRGIFLQGWQIQTDETMKAAQVVQVWLISPIVR